MTAQTVTDRTQSRLENFDDLKRVSDAMTRIEKNGWLADAGPLNEFVLAHGLIQKLISKSGDEAWLEKSWFKCWQGVMLGTSQIQALISRRAAAVINDDSLVVSVSVEFQRDLDAERAADAASNGKFGLEVG